MEPLIIYDRFKQLFPLFDARRFESAGKYSIKIYTSVPDLTFIFTFKSPMEWRFETTELFGWTINDNTEKENDIHEF